MYTNMSHDACRNFKMFSKFAHRRLLIYAYSQDFNFVHNMDAILRQIKTEMTKKTALFKSVDELRGCHHEYKTVALGRFRDHRLFLYNKVSK